MCAARCAFAVHGGAVRLLGIGLPLSLVLVLAVGLMLPLGLSVAVVLAIACIAVPADFSPETSLVRDERIPARVRRWLSVESGYNDGLVSPLLLAALAFASAGTTGDAGRAFAVAAPAGSSPFSSRGGGRGHRRRDPLRR